MDLGQSALEAVVSGVMGGSALQTSRPSLSGRFEVQSTPLAGLEVYVRKPIGDERGWLERVFCAQDLADWGGAQSIAQINRTMTARRGTVRGLHFQRPPHAEAKLVSCLRGQIFDVVVDVRRGSSTFLHWYGDILSEDNRRSLAIPAGFAHGFQTLTDNCEVLYLHTAAYRSDAEGALNVRDPQLKIDWPLAIEGLSDRDQGHALIGADFLGLDMTC